MEKDIEALKLEIDQERKSRTEFDRSRKRLEAENDDLNNKLDAEIKNRQKLEKLAKKLNMDIRATKTLLDDASATKTQQECILYDDVFV